MIIADVSLIIVDEVLAAVMVISLFPWRWMRCRVCHAISVDRWRQQLRKTVGASKDMEMAGGSVKVEVTLGSSGRRSSLDVGLVVQCSISLAIVQGKVEMVVEVVAKVLAKAPVRTNQRMVVRVEVRARINHAASKEQRAKAEVMAARVWDAVVTWNIASGVDVPDILLEIAV